WSMNADQAPLATRKTTTGSVTATPPAVAQPRSDTSRRRSRTATATMNTVAAPVTRTPTLGFDQNANAQPAPAAARAIAARRRSSRRSYQTSTAKSATTAPSAANEEYELVYATSGDP